MANPTSNFGWQMPTNTDLVKDLPADFEVFGQAVDTSLMDLKGGTTGQVLSKASNTDMDFTWVTSDDANAIQNTIVDAKGDLISATGNDVPARLAVGNNGENLVADSSATTGLRWQGNFAAGKNKIINGDFLINQRAFTSNTITGLYNFDRFFQANVGGTVTVTPQTFTLGTAPVAGYEGKNFLQCDVTGQSAVGDLAYIQQRIESVRTFANQTVTISFWAKATSGTPSVAVSLNQGFGTGGSPSATVATAFGKTAISTSWTRYSFTAALPSIAGKTIGTNNDDHVRVIIWFSAGTNFNSETTSLGTQTNTFQVWGVQAEAGNTATAFQTATGTLAGELQAAQRYYIRIGGTSLYEALGTYASAYSTTIVDPFVIPLPVRLRSASSSTLEAANIMITDGVTTYSTGTFTMSSYRSLDSLAIKYTHGSAALTQYRPYLITANNSTSAYIGYSAEL